MSSELILVWIESRYSSNVVVSGDSEIDVRQFPHPLTIVQLRPVVLGDRLFWLAGCASYSTLR